MTILENTDTTTIVGMPIPPAPSGVAFQRVIHPACVTASCPKRTSDHPGYVAIWHDDANRKAMCAALIDSFNTMMVSGRVLQAVVKVMGMMGLGVPNFENGVGQTGYELPGDVEVHKTFGPLEYYEHAADYLTVSYDSATFNPLSLANNQSGTFRLAGWGTGELDNSVLQDAAQIDFSHCDIDTINERIKFYTITPLPTGDDLSTPIDELSPVTFSFRILVGTGRESWTELHDLTPFYGVLRTWSPASWPPANGEMVMRSGEPIAPLWTSQYLTVETYNATTETWTNVPELAIQTYIYNAWTGSGWQGVILFGPGGITLGAFDNIRVTGYWKDNSATNSWPVCNDRCAYSYPDYTYTVGAADSPANNAKWHCEKYDLLTADEKSKYIPACLNQNCAQWGGPRTVSNNLMAALAQIVNARYARRYNQYVGGVGPGDYTLEVKNFPGLRALCDEDMTLEGVRCDNEDWIISGEGGWGTLDDYLFYNSTIGEYVTKVRRVTGFEVQSPTIAADTAGPGGANKTSPTISYGNLAADASTDPSSAIRNSLTNGPCGVKKVGNVEIGELARHIDFRLTWLLFPQINSAVSGWQDYEDGSIKCGFWTADYTEQVAEDANTVYRLCVQLHSGIKPFKGVAYKRPPAEVTTITLNNTFSATVSGATGLSLRHKQTTLAKPVGSAPDRIEDASTTVYMAGVNVLPPHSKRVRSIPCPESIQGAGAGGTYILPGMALKITTAKGDYLLPIVRALDCDSTVAHVDPNYNSAGNLAEMNAADSINLQLARSVSDYQYCDTIEVLDPASVLSTITVGGYVATVVEGVYAMEDAANEKFYISGVAVTDSEYASVGKLHHSGRFYFQTIPECLVMKIKMACFAPVVSKLNDIDVFNDAIDRMWSE